MATLHMIGTLMEVKPTEYEDKKTGKMNYNTELTVMFNGVDEEGYKKISVETISTDEEYYDDLKEKIGFTVSLPYVMKIDQYGVKVYPDRSMPVLVLEKNPLDYSKFERKSKTVAK
ncbi:hypothetical protein [Sulfurimonas xiamenensis]|uniref:Uncharacterized protein n=1 Tax=Sulfurimonas xiamenensis TaxID=2590021 RepID=A0AAJ4A473_9BACT|nr:hypothetical protein [Sulfurimonas xiamenensis]QFR43616.1 hypothetical protein FJR47_06710 [Sulfurimonas xiamenensis]